MDDYALVLNAGSSSLKFCVYRRPEGETWRLESRGQIEGIGTSPRFSAKDGSGAILDERQPSASVTDASTALDALAGWLRSRYGGARVLGVGHRVVHGGAKFSGPTVVTPSVLDDLRKLVPLAPLHQPYNLAAIEAVAERLPGGAASCLFRHQLSSWAAGVAELIPLPRDLVRSGIQRYGFHGLSYEYIASALPQVAPEIAGGRVIVAHLGSGASLCALKNGRASTTAGIHGARRSVHGNAAGGPRSRRRPLSLSGAGPLRKRSRDDSLQEIRSARHLRHQQRHARPARRREPEARLAVDYFVYRAAKEIGALAAVLGGIDGLVFTAGIGENSAADSRGASARRAPGWASSSMKRPTHARRRGSLDPEAASPLGDSDQRRTDDRSAHRDVAGARLSIRCGKQEVRRLPWL